MILGDTMLRFIVALLVTSWWLSDVGASSDFAERSCGVASLLSVSERDLLPIGQRNCDELSLPTDTRPGPPPLNADGCLCVEYCDQRRLVCGCPLNGVTDIGVWPELDDSIRSVNSTKCTHWGRDLSLISANLFMAHGLALFGPFCVVACAAVLRMSQLKRWKRSSLQSATVSLSVVYGLSYTIHYARDPTGNDRTIFEYYALSFTPTFLTWGLYIATLPFIQDLTSELFAETHTAGANALIRIAVCVVISATFCFVCVALQAQKVLFIAIAVALFISFATSIYYTRRLLARLSLPVPGFVLLDDRPRARSRRKMEIFFYTAIASTLFQAIALIGGLLLLSQSPTIFSSMILYTVWRSAEWVWACCLLWTFWPRLNVRIDVPRSNPRIEIPRPNPKIAENYKFEVQRQRQQQIREQKDKASAINDQRSDGSDGSGTREQHGDVRGRRGGQVVGAVGAGVKQGPYIIVMVDASPFALGATVIGVGVTAVGREAACNDICAKAGGVAQETPAMKKGEIVHRTSDHVRPASLPISSVSKLAWTSFKDASGRFVGRRDNDGQNNLSSSLPAVVAGSTEPRAESPPTHATDCTTHAEYLSSPRLASVSTKLPS